MDFDLDENVDVSDLISYFKYYYLFRSIDKNNANQISVKDMS